jgi:hypothetical protein
MFFSFDFAIEGSHRRFPTGGSAYGIPRNWATLGVVPLIRPVTGPEVVPTVKLLTARAGRNCSRARSRPRMTAIVDARKIEENMKDYILTQYQDCG